MRFFTGKSECQKEVDRLKELVDANCRLVEVTRYPNRSGWARGKRSIEPVDPYKCRLFAQEFADALEACQQAASNNKR